MPDAKTLSPKVKQTTYRILAANGRPVRTQAGAPVRTEQQ